MSNMRSPYLVGAVVLIAVGIGLYFYLDRVPVPDMPLPIVETPMPKVRHEIIGRSVMDRSIDAYTYGSGSTTLVFVGGLHGGYEWNSTLLAYQFMDYLETRLGVIPATLSIVVVPNANPDGMVRIIGKEGRFALADVPDGDHSEGRFNANGVDLNRNFDCKWEESSMWRGRTVSAGTEPFSEPEAKALQNLVSRIKPDAVIFWHSQANAVYASECEDGVLPETLEIMHAYAKASGYEPVESFTSYSVTGDAEGWLASIGIPAITVELSSHETVEWEQNIAGVEALFEHYGNR